VKIPTIPTKNPESRVRVLARVLCEELTDDELLFVSGGSGPLNNNHSQKEGGDD
jgi:hypothetical protein